MAASPHIASDSFRAAPVFLAILVASVGGAICMAADQPVTITIRDGGKDIAVGQDDVAEGQRLILALLRTCRSRDQGVAGSRRSDFDDAMKKDCLHVVFAESVALADGDIKISELVLTQPTANGVFWLRVGDKIRQFSRYDQIKQAELDAWVRQVHQ